MRKDTLEPVPAELLARIERERGLVREWPRLLAARDPEFTLKLHELAMLALSRPGELPLKFRELILVALNAADDCERGFRIHVRSALRGGATEGEILEVLEVVSILHLHGLTGMLPAFEEEVRAFNDVQAQGSTQT